MQVDLYESGTIAIVEAVSPELGNRVQRVRVQLPGTSQELLSKFREKKVDFAAHTATEDGGAVFLNLLGESCGLLAVKLPVWTFMSVVMREQTVVVYLEGPGRLARPAVLHERFCSWLLLYLGDQNQSLFAAIAVAPAVSTIVSKVLDKMLILLCISLTEVCELRCLQKCYAHSIADRLVTVIFMFAGNLAFPLLLVGGLFLLSRRQGGGMGGPGGNNPMNFGKSKAKFQMEPNTGITFADVAGVEEAKADFMEVWITASVNGSLLFCPPGWHQADSGNNYGVCPTTCL